MTIAATIVQQAGVTEFAKPELVRLREATDGFESLFVQQLMGEMRKGLNQTPLGQGFGSSQYRDLFDTAFAEKIAGAGSLGIGHDMFRKMAPRVIEQARVALRAQTKTEGQS